MKKTYHLCLSAGEEVLFRDLEDYNRGFNSFAIALYKTGSSGLVESFMSTHSHQLVQTEGPAELMYFFRISYSMYFNRKYHRSGKLEMGKSPCQRLIDPRHYRRFIGKNAEYPASYKMSESGVFLRESVLDIPQVENLFVTPRAFNWYMSRKSSEEWEAEQGKDKNGKAPINIATIESGVITDSTEKMLIYENGKADYRRPSDIDICTEIDRNILPKYGKPSIYMLTRQEKQQIAEHLYRNLRIGERQIRRCLVL